MSIGNNNKNMKANKKANKNNKSVKNNVKNSNDNDADNKVVIPNGSNEQREEDIEREEKLGRTCFGFCCDMRRAVIIMSILGILFAIGGLVGDYVTIYVGAYDNYDDDNVFNQEDKNNQLDRLFVIDIVLRCINIIGYVLGIIGAIKYNSKLLKMNVVIIITYFITSTIMFIKTSNDIESYEYGAIQMIGPIIGTVMGIYINKTLAKEINNGIMSIDTYKIREEHSCCCV